MDNTILDGSTVFDPGRVKITTVGNTHSTPHFFHSQKFWEFVYVHDGFALLGGEGSSVLLSEGDLVVIAPGETHSLVCPGGAELHCLLFMDSELGSMKDELFALPGFLELSLRAKAVDSAIARPKNFRYESIRLDYAERAEFVRLCDRISSERVRKNKGWQQLVKSYLGIALVFYSRLDLTAKRAERDSDEIKGVYSKIIKSIESNYKSNITGTELASQAGYSAEYLTKQFRNHLEISPAEYLRRYRVAKSMELLRSTDMPVNEVATECGFVDMSAFSRVFRSLAGDTPSGYRKRFRR